MLKDERCGSLGEPQRSSFFPLQTDPSLGLRRGQDCASARKPAQRGRTVQSGLLQNNYLPGHTACDSPKWLWLAGTDVGNLGFPTSMPPCTAVWDGRRRCGLAGSNFGIFWTELCARIALCARSHVARFHERGIQCEHELENKLKNWWSTRSKSHTRRVPAREDAVEKTQSRRRT